MPEQRGPWGAKPVKKATKGPSVAELPVVGALERVAVNHSFVAGRINQAVANILSARRELSDNPAGAFTLAYDATRFAIDARINADGHRIPNRPGAHQTAID
jgi:hypothetical protein